MARLDEKAHRLRQDWNRLASSDPMWAVATWKGKRKGQSTPWSVEEFLETGEQDARRFLALSEESYHL